MIKRLILLLLAPCAAPTATLVAAEVDQSLPLPETRVEESSSSEKDSKQRFRFVDFTRKCFSPVAKVFGSLRNSIAPTQTIDLVETSLPEHLHLASESYHEASVSFAYESLACVYSLGRHPHVSDDVFSTAQQQFSRTVCMRL